MELAFCKCTHAVECAGSENKFKKPFGKSWHKRRISLNLVARELIIELTIAEQSMHFSAPAFCKIPCAKCAFYQSE